jgi:predicted RNase H-like HicB family nuclease
VAREIILIVEESPEGGYEARAVGHSVFAEAETLDDLRTRIQDAVRCHFESAEMPDLIRLHQVRDEVIAA